MVTYKGIQTFTPSSAEEWRVWLQENHERAEAVWLIVFKKKTGIPSVEWSEAVDEALCFGWIDGKRNSRDKQSYYQFYTRRKPKSAWSRINREKVDRLISEGKMTPAGMAMVELAKKTGTWTELEDVENEVVPNDLQTMLDQNQTAKKNWENFPPSSKRLILYWIQSAKTTPTREKRITETVEKAAENIRANHYRQ